jgi:ATP synthase protein I
VNAHDATLLRGSALPTLAVGVLAVVVGALVAGGKGALAAALATLVVVVFFGISALVVGRVSNPALMMNVALLTYVVKILVLLLLIALLADASWLDGAVFGLTVVACTLVWTGFELRAFMRLRILYADPDEAGRH